MAQHPPILGIDPGIRHTGWCMVRSGRPARHGLIVTPGEGKLLVPQVMDYVLSRIGDVVGQERPALAVVEEVVWRGLRRRITMPLSHVAGAIGGFLCGSGLDVYYLIPSMKERTPLRVRGEWSEHELDAAQLALRIYRTVFNATNLSGRQKVALDKSRITIAARLVHGQLTRNDLGD